MKEYLHENTVLHTTTYYQLARGKRFHSEYIKASKDNKRSVFKFEAYMRLPLLLLPVTWRRYEYSKQDVFRTFQKIDTVYLWQISLMLLCGEQDYSGAVAGVKSTFQSLFSFLFVSRKTLLDNFIAAHMDYVNTDNKQSRLCHERPDHKPLLPKIPIPKTDFDRLKLMIPKHHPSFRRVLVYSSYYIFKDIFLIPVQFDETLALLYMCRIISESTFNSIPCVPKQCVITLPVKIVVGNENFVMLEESCFFYTDTQ